MLTLLFYEIIRTIFFTVFISLTFFKILFWNKKAHLRIVKHARLIIGAMQPYSSKTGNMRLPVMAPTLPIIISMLTAMALTNEK